MNWFRNFRDDQGGNVFIIAAATISVLIAVAGAGIDLGRQQLVKLRLQQASDAAALAGASLQNSPTDAERFQAAQRYFNLNYPSEYMGIARPTPTISIAGGEVTVAANSPVSTIFVKQVDMNVTQAAGRSKVSTSTSTTEADYDVVMVVDESGSTGARAPGGGGTIMDVEKEAISDMISSIFPTEENNKVRFGVVGYTGSISLLGPLTAIKSKALSYVGQLQSRCQNFDHYGFEAGTNVLSGIWAASGQPTGACTGTSWSRAGYATNFAVQRNTAALPPTSTRSDGKKLSDAKHLVFLTDGYIMIEPPGCPASPCYRDFLASCTAAKNADIIVHTISFVSQSSGDSATLRQCASTDADGKPRYYYAPDGATLKSILKNVGSSIKKTRISE